jgi:glycosyltransferase involved in cell wall biosynthesis
MNHPCVSCIMPTANRQKYLPLAVNYFLSQDYKNSELIIIDDGLQSAEDLLPKDPKIRYYYIPPVGTIGKKRNYACELAKGEIILHLDDDDWYASDWITKHVNALTTSGADITGLNRVIFYSPALNQRYMYEDVEEDKPWLCGATMAYRKTFWENYKFVDLQVGEDYDFVWNSGGTIFPLDYLGGFIAILHAHNTSIKPVENPRHKKHAQAWKEGQKSE